MEFSVWKSMKNFPVFEGRLIAVSVEISVVWVRLYILYFKLNVWKFFYKLLTYFICLFPVSEMPGEKHCHLIFSEDLLIGAISGVSSSALGLLWNIEHCNAVLAEDLKNLKLGNNFKPEYKVRLWFVHFQFLFLFVFQYGDGKLSLTAMKVLQITVTCIFHLLKVSNDLF